MNVGDVPCFNIHQSHDFEFPDAVVDAGGVVAAGLIAVEASRVDSGVANAFLDRHVEERTSCLGWNPFEPRTENRVMRKPRETEFFEGTGHFAEQIHCDAVGFAQLDAESMEDGYRLFAEPASPFGSVGTSGVATTY